MSTYTGGIEDHIRDSEREEGELQQAQVHANRELQGLRDQLHDLENKHQLKLKPIRDIVQQAEAKKKDADAAHQRALDEYSAKQKEFESARQRFDTAEEAKQKADQTYQEINDMYVTVTAESRQKEKTAEDELRTATDNLRRQIADKENMIRSDQMKQENVRRDITMWRERLQRAQKDEMEKMRQEAANNNNPPSATSNHAPRW